MFSTSSAILSIQSFTVLLDRGIVFNLEATCVPHIISTILTQAGLISVSPMVCVSLDCTTRRAHSKEAIVACLWSPPVLVKVFRMFWGLFDSTSSFFQRKKPSVYPFTHFRVFVCGKKKTMIFLDS